MSVRNRILVAAMTVMSALAGAGALLDGRYPVAGIWAVASFAYALILIHASGGVRPLVNGMLEQYSLLRQRAATSKHPSYLYSCLECGLVDPFTLPVRIRCRECDGRIELKRRL